ncbi:MAG TPA: hypothetical protein VHM23_27395 [Actinomycetota bacterium]|jgi:hypothetical protein|nr:hypothetical protein [Actinomycetota bacterium]
MSSRQSPVASAPGREPGNIGKRGLEHETGTVARGSRLEALDAVRRAVEPRLSRHPGIDGGDGTVAGRIEEDRGGVGGVLHQPTPMQPAAGEATGGHPPAADAEIETGPPLRTRSQPPMRNNGSETGGSIVERKLEATKEQHADATDDHGHRPRRGGATAIGAIILLVIAPAPTAGRHASFGTIGGQWGLRPVEPGSSASCGTPPEMGR